MRSKYSFDLHREVAERLGIAAAIGLFVIGRFNLISVAFIPLFVGLGVDFNIQYSVRSRAERLIHPQLPAALVAAGCGVGSALALSAAAISVVGWP
jgi:uncharacterized protein